jgi:subtilisin family serine protease
VNQLAERKPRPVIIAASGNYKDSNLAYPARFGGVLAIGGITSQRVLSSDCNSGDTDQSGSLHQNHFVLPGGESDPSRLEAVMTSTGSKNWSGSSFACGFASGLVAALLSQQGSQNFNFDLFVDGLRKRSDKNLPNYSKAEHGNGLMRA